MNNDDVLKEQENKDGHIDCTCTSGGTVQGSEDWEKDFDQKFRPLSQFNSTSSLYNATEDVKSFIRSLVAEVRAEEYRNGSKRIEAILLSREKEIANRIIEMIPDYLPACAPYGSVCKTCEYAWPKLQPLKENLLQEIEKMKPLP